ncbi:MAG: N-6 DNA methylase [Candidatus Thorarchaeota archaeon]
MNDAFEVFVSKKLKEDGGQFFTPISVVEFMVKYLNPDIGDKIIDPACGHGGFLLEVIDHIWNKISKNPSLSDEEKNDKKVSIISDLYGIDKDFTLSKISKIYIEILTKGKCNIFCEDSLDPNSYQIEVKKKIRDDKFDYVFTNPPFGAKIPIDDKKILENYELGYQWKFSSKEIWERQNRLLQKQPPQILFIERCVQLLTEGGKLGIVLPEGIFGNPSDRYIWHYLKSKGKILGIASLDQNTFQPYTSNKTSILFFEKSSKVPEDYYLDFAIVNYIGHDKDGKILYKLNKDGSIIIDPNTNEPIVNNELKELTNRMKTSEIFDHLKEQNVFKLNLNQIKSDIYIPNYYLGVEKTLKKIGMDKRYKLITIGDLVKKRTIFTNNNGYIPRGDEIGSKVYGLGEIPFIRTSEIHNWEVNLDSNKKTSMEVYMKYKKKQNIEVGDILLVKDGGSNHIGKTAYITELDTKIIIQSHIFQIKILANDKAINSYLLLYLLNLDIVQKQMQAITFIQGTIATIGNRIMDIILPMPKKFTKRKEISDYIKEIINNKTEIRKKLHNLDNFFK